MAACVVNTAACVVIIAAFVDVTTFWIEVDAAGEPEVVGIVVADLWDVVGAVCKHEIIN